jgi:hypothetical protein
MLRFQRKRVKITNLQMRIKKRIKRRLQKEFLWNILMPK